MKNNRYEMEIKRMYEDFSTAQIFNETVDDMILFRCRYQLKELILYVIVNNQEKIKTIRIPNKLKFLREYKQFLLQTKNMYPQFIFDDFEVEKFGKCVELKKEGKSLIEVEEYYLNELCDKKVR